MIKKVAATAMVGSIVALKFSHIIIGRVLVLAPDTKMVTTTSSSEVTNDSNAPVTTEFLQVAAYMIPWSNILPLILLVISFLLFRAVFAIIKTIWKFIPFLGN